MSSLRIVLVFAVALIVWGMTDLQARVAPAEQSPAAASSPAGQDILTLQLALILCGYSPGPLDGIYGPQTAAAVNAFISERGEIAGETELAFRVATVASLMKHEFAAPSHFERTRQFIELRTLRSKQDAISFPHDAVPTARTGATSLFPLPVAENGDVRGADNDGDGRTEPVYVRGYYRKDGTYIRSHYRARPHRR